MAVVVSVEGAVACAEGRLGELGPEAGRGVTARVGRGFEASMVVY